MPLRQLSEAGHGVLVVHHQGKDFKGPRGGSEFAAFADILIDFQRNRFGGPNDRRRVLQCQGRPRGIPPRLIIALAEDGSGYTVLEGASATANPSVRQLLVQILPPAPLGLTAEEVRAAWPADLESVALKTIQNELARGAKEVPPAWKRSGKGAKNDPHRYWCERPIGPDLTTTLS